MKEKYKYQEVVYDTFEEIGKEVDEIHCLGTEPLIETKVKTGIIYLYSDNTEEMIEEKEKNELELLEKEIKVIIDKEQFNSFVGIDIISSTNNNYLKQRYIELYTKYNT